MVTSGLSDRKVKKTVLPDLCSGGIPTSASLGSLIQAFFVHSSPLLTPGWRAYTRIPQAQGWCQRAAALECHFLGGFGFTETALIPGISAAGATPAHRRQTALADAEVLLQGYSPRLPTSPDGYPSPVVISRAVLQHFGIPLHLFDCGLPTTLPALIPAIPAIANCLSTGRAMRVEQVQQRFELGLAWGSRLAQSNRILVMGECVAGGTSTALAVLLGLGYPVAGMVNSSHPTCNHSQKLELAQRGLSQVLTDSSGIEILAAVGDPMQPLAAGLALAASRQGAVLLAGGTQMLAVYALMQRLAQEQQLDWDPEQVVVGTTRWVAEDPTGNSVGLAQMVGEVPLLACQLSFAHSRYPQLQAYERGYVKEGVGAGGLALMASLKQWDPVEMVAAIEDIYRSLIAP